MGAVHHYCSWRASFELVEAVEAVEDSTIEWARNYEVPERFITLWKKS